jgi:arylsulfatase A-like enzyme
MPIHLRITVLSALLAVTAFTQDKPNVVFILVDDQGYYDLGCYGATEVKTPRIDAMAKQGVRFTDYYAPAPICSPSRAGLLTGCYPRRIGMNAWVHRADSKLGLNPDELTLGELFKANGYATACVGKWHLGFKEQFLPNQQGFDEYFGLLHNLDPVETVYFQETGGVPLMRNNKVVKRPADNDALTRIYTDEAIAFMERSKDEPFFLYLPHTALHRPYGVSEPFKGKSEFGEYGDGVQEMDHNVGRVFDALKRLGIDQKTVVVYASDNGRGPGRNATQPLRGNKLTTNEAGIRVPCIAWGPGLKIRAGYTSSAIVRGMDWYPTLASLAGIRVPEGRVIDGRDFSPLLTGKTEHVPKPSEKLSLNADVPLRRNWRQGGEWADQFTRDEYNDAFFYFGSEGALSALRSGKYKLYLSPGLQLYDLQADPGEVKPVLGKKRGRIPYRMRGMAVTFQEEMTLDARRPGAAE